MGTVEKNFAPLTVDLDELSLNLEKSREVYERTFGFSEILGAIKLDSDENAKSFEKGMKEMASIQLTFLRDNIEIIKKTSPETAKKLENEVNQYESDIQQFNNYIKHIVGKTKRQLLKDLKLQEMTMRMVISSNRIDEMVSYPANVLLDTITFLARE